MFPESKGKQEGPGVYPGDRVAGWLHLCDSEDNQDWAVVQPHHEQWQQGVQVPAQHPLLAGLWHGLLPGPELQVLDFSTK